MRMKISKVIGPTRWGPIEVEVKCPKCGHTRRAMRSEARRGLSCSKCASRERLEKKQADTAKRKPRNVTPGGIALGAAPPHGPAWLILELLPDATMRVRLARDVPGNAGPRMRYGVQFPDRDMAVSMLDLLGRNPEGDFLTLACRIRDMHAALTGGV